MSPLKWSSKVDANQPEIVFALRKAGVSVLPIHRLGQGCPDLLCGVRHQNWLFEVKDGSKPPSARALTPDEKRWRNKWAGQVETITTAEEALLIMGILDEL